MNITIFKNIKETSAPFHRGVDFVLGRIKDGASKDLVMKIRSENSKSTRNELKKELPAICFSGIFSQRRDDAMVEHSGLLCLDFDGYGSRSDMLEDKETFSKDRYVYSVFISPSGKGLKVLVKIPRDRDNHTKYFDSIQEHFNSPYFDKSTKNISRVCYESYDPLIFTNQEPEMWTKVLEQKYKEVTTIDAPTLPITDKGKVADILLRWWEKKYPMSDGSRNNNMYVIASAFNDFGVEKSTAQFILRQYEQEDFNADEINTTIDSAYRQTQNFNTKYYEDTERVNLVKKKVVAGEDISSIRAELVSKDIDAKVIDSLVENIQSQTDENVFWTKSEKGAIKIVHVMFKIFLENNGFYKYQPKGSKNFIFVRVTNNLIDHASDSQIKDYVLEHLLENDELDVYNYFAEHTKYFKAEFLTLLKSIDVYFVEDKKDMSFLYYKNCAVKVTKDEITAIDYLDLGGYVWKDHVIDRNYNRCSGSESDFKKFVSNICSNDESRIKSMESTIGFLMHGHKDASYCPAVIFNDEVISENPEGGTGKGLVMQGISKMKKLVILDGKSFTFEKSFPYQTVSVDTQVICFDDVRKHFNFERLFSVVTEGLTLEKKNKDAINIPFDKSPKVTITTNYAIKGSGNSFARRKWELELKQHYSKDYTPFDEFGKMMFQDWTDDEWCIFDNYMIGNLQFYLNNGFIKSDFVNLKIRKLSAETCHEFIEWCGLIDGSVPSEKLIPNMRIPKSELYDDFVEENPDFAPKAKMTVSRKKFGSWLNKYCLYKYGIEPEEGRDSNGKWIRIRNKHELEQTRPLF